MTTLDKIYAELQQLDTDGSPTQEAFDLVDLLLSELGEDGIADKIIDLTPTTTSWENTAIILAIMIWSTSDNGAQISRDSERWLVKCEDERRLFIAMNLDSYPFINRSEMELYLNQVAERFPKLSASSHRMINSRRQLKET